MSSSSFYDTIAHHYDTYCTTSGIHDYLEEEILILEHYSPSSVLELGIGTGRFAQAYLQKHPYVSYAGIDNSQAMLQKIQDKNIICIHADFEIYSKKLLQEEKYYGAVVAPYTALHHIQTAKQIELLTTLQQLAPVVILNCLHKDEEEKLFQDEELSTCITFPLPENKEAATEIYPIHKDIRNQALCIPSKKERVYLIFENK